MYAAPIILAGTETFTIAFSAGLSSGYTHTFSGATSAALLTGTYNDVVTAGSFASLIKDELDQAELDAGNTATWAVSTPGSGLTFRLALTRAGDTGDAVSSVVCGIGTTHFGWSDTTLLAAGSELAVSAPNAVITGAYQRGFVWLPRVQLTRVEAWGVSTVATSRTNDGSTSVVDGYGDYRVIQHTIDFVRPAMVYQFAATDVQSLGYGDCFASLTAGDENVPFETFWRHLAGNTGAAPVVRYYQDSGTLSSPESITFADGDWLSSTQNAVEELAESPAVYRVRMRGHVTV
jgi:hypothetical protein